MYQGWIHPYHDCVPYSMDRVKPGLPRDTVSGTIQYFILGSTIGTYPVRTQIDPYSETCYSDPTPVVSLYSQLCWYLNPYWYCTGLYKGVHKDQRIPR